MRNEEHRPLIEKTGDNTTLSLRSSLGDFRGKVRVVTLLRHFCHTSSHFALYTLSKCLRGSISSQEDQCELSRKKRERSSERKRRLYMTDDSLRRWAGICGIVAFIL